MRRKRDYKTIQLGFKHQSDYEKFHKKAMSVCGEYRNADCEYLRHCIKEESRRRTVAEKKKIQALVVNQQVLNELLNTVENPAVREKIIQLEQESMKIWDI